MGDHPDDPFVRLFLEFHYLPGQLFDQQERVHETAVHKRGFDAAVDAAVRCPDHRLVVEFQPGQLAGQFAGRFRQRKPFDLRKILDFQ